MYLSPDEALSQHNAAAFPINREPTGTEYRRGHFLRMEILDRIVQSGYEMECRFVYAVKDAAAKYELARTFGSEHLAAEFLDRILENNGPMEMAEVILTLMGYGYDQINAEYNACPACPF